MTTRRTFIKAKETTSLTDRIHTFEKWWCKGNLDRTTACTALQFHNHWSTRGTFFSDIQTVVGVGDRKGQEYFKLRGTALCKPPSLKHTFSRINLLCKNAWILLISIQLCIQQCRINFKVRGNLSLDPELTKGRILVFELQKNLKRHTIIQSKRKFRKFTHNIETNT